MVRVLVGQRSADPEEPQIDRPVRHPLVHRVQRRLVVLPDRTDPHHRPVRGQHVPARTGPPAACSIAVMTRLLPTPHQLTAARPAQASADRSRDARDLRTLGRRPGEPRRWCTMDALDLARWQFGITTVYHFLFVPLTIGLSVLVAGLQTAWVPHRQASSTCG